MASKKTKNTKQYKPVEKRETTSASTRMMQILFLLISIVVVLSMILSATATF